MLVLPEDLRQGISTACRRYGVARMHVFGSALRDDFRPESSDIDLLVEFAALTPHQLVDAYFSLLDELRELLGGRVDLVMSDAVKNRFVLADIERTKRLLYAA